MLSFLFEMNYMGLTDVKEEVIFKYCGGIGRNTECPGYWNAVREVINTLGYVERHPDLTLGLTKKGLEHMTSISSKPGGKCRFVVPRTNHQVELAYKKRILTFSERRVTSTALDNIWRVLQDGMPHKCGELMEAVRHRSAGGGYREIIKWMKYLGLVENAGPIGNSSLQFVMEKVFPFDI